MQGIEDIDAVFENRVRPAILVQTIAERQRQDGKCLQDRPVGRPVHQEDADGDKDQVEDDECLHGPQFL